jgi:16S rRNA (cytosine1402-N4)-methyltransferase
MPRPNPDYCLRVLTRRPVGAADAEVAQNARARSAKLRVAEKLSGEDA